MALWLSTKPERTVEFNFETVLGYQKAVDFADVVFGHTGRFERG
jgi:hypothetical protein